MDGETTSLTHASNKTQSLRTTVPAGIVKQFGLKVGDKLEWKIKAENKGKLVVVVTPTSSRNEREGVQ